MRTVIRNGTVVGFNGQEHVIIEKGVVVYDDDRIAYVGFNYDGPADKEIDATGKLVTPGFINTHLHAGTLSQFRFVSDYGKREFFGAGYLNYRTPGKGRKMRPEDPEIAALVTIVELLKWGTTTCVEVGTTPEIAEKLVEVAGALGIRGFFGVGYRSAEHYFENNRLYFDFDDERGRRRLDQAVDFIQRHRGKFNGRIQGMLYPMQVDSCTTELMRLSAEKAREIDVGVSIHTAQNLMEFHRIVGQFAKTPVELLDEVGLLGPRTILGHCCFTTAHPATHFPGDDLELIVRSGASVAHCPVASSRRSHILHSFSKYVRRGINVSIGTDSFPRDIIREMGFVGPFNKVIDEDVTVGTSREVFNAATLGGARAVGLQGQIGALAPGYKADILVINMRSLRVGPVWDPVKSLIECGVGDMVDLSIIDGRTVVEGGRVVGVDEEELYRREQEEAAAMFADFQNWDWAGRKPEDVFTWAFRKATQEDFPAPPAGDGQGAAAR
mgnify:FL=1